MGELGQEFLDNYFVVQAVQAGQAAKACSEEGDKNTDNAGNEVKGIDVDVYAREDALLFHEPPTLVRLLRRMPIVGRVLQSKV